MNQIPRIGVGVAVKRGTKFLFMRRKNAHGEGAWAFPGGHLEFKESIIECAKREVLEEAGLKIENARILTFFEDFFEKENKHYITFVVLADCHMGEPAIIEPEKCDAIKWCDWQNLPSPLFLTITQLHASGIIDVVLQDPCVAKTIFLPDQSGIELRSPTMLNEPSIKAV